MRTRSARRSSPRSWRGWPETGLWLISADVTGNGDGDRIGVGPTCVINPAGEVVAQVPTGTTGIAIAQISQP